MIKGRSVCGASTAATIASNPAGLKEEEGRKKVY
jgi:hypothetical protein